jgi:hypothetical protein
MKQFILYSCYCCLCATICNAQNNAETTGDESEFSIGPVAGFGPAWIAPGANTQYYPSWSAGVMAIYSPYEWWGIGYDIRYSVEGGKNHYEFGDRTTKLQYVRIPVKGMVFFGDYEDDFRPKLTLGPSLGFLIDGSDDFNAETYPFDFGVNASAGFNYRLRPGAWLNFGLNFYQGVLDVRKNTGKREFNGNLGLDFGISFGI